MVEITTPPHVVFEDDDLLVVDKPGGLVCHSAQRPGQPALVAWVREHLEKATVQHPTLSTQHATVQTPPVIPRLINRLDRETSGLVVIAKNERAARILGKQVLRREIEKTYIAICWDEFKESRGTIDQPIGIATNSVLYTKRAVVADGGKACVTEFEVTQRLPGFTVVRLRPRTGRAHQLRVHMSWLGHPIVGDKMYGPDETLYLQFIKKGVTTEMLAKLLLPRHALHAEMVVLRHPSTGEFREFKAPLPADMEAFIRGRS